MANHIAHDGETKVCSRCGPPAKPLADFNRRSGRGGGYQSKCRQCQKEMQAVWYAKNARREYERTRAYLIAHPDVKSAGDRAYRLAHPEAVKVIAKRFRQTPHGKSEHRRIESARRAQKLGQFVEQVDPTIVFEMHGGRCGICSEFIDRREGFHVDHIIPLARGGMHSYLNTQPAHPRCNLQKGWLR